MAWVTTRLVSAGTSYTVVWRENERRKRSRTFPSGEAAASFKADIEKLWPPKTGGNQLGVRGTRQVKTPRQRIEENVVQDANGCWLWTRTLGNSGYGQMSIVENGKAKTKLSHRMSYEAFVGPIPVGLQLDHLCRVRRCVNPEHLEPVTAKENIRRSPIHVSARYRAQGICAQGHVLAEVGMYKGGVNGTTCKPCSQARSAAYKSRKAAEAGAA